jgi:hypothetical protein
MITFLFIQKEKRRESFIAELRKTMLEDQYRNGGNTKGLISLANDNDANHFLTVDGKLTEAFKMELQELSKE